MKKARKFSYRYCTVCGNTFQKMECVSIFTTGSAGKVCKDDYCKDCSDIVSNLFGGNRTGRTKNELILKRKGENAVL